MYSFTKKNSRTSIIEIHGRKVILNRKKMKYIRLRVDPITAEIRISAPTWSSKNEICKMFIENILWVDDQVLRAEKNKINRENKFKTGACVQIWGENYRLVVANEPRTTGSIIHHADKTVTLHVATDFTSEMVAQCIDEMYRNLLREVVFEYLQLWSPVVGVKVPKVTLRKMKTRWGSCNATLQKINLNIMLVQYPTKCLEYVIVHELAHLIESNHSQRFWNIVDKAMPEWKTYHNHLNTKTCSTL